MGTPRKQRRSFTRPKHPWRTERIQEERELCKKYGLTNKREAWRAKSDLGRVRQQARRLLADTTEEAEKEKREMIAKLNRWGIDIKSVDDVLGLSVEDLLERRLQSIVYRRGYANTPKQARQFIVHNHVYVGSHKVSVPGYIVLAGEEEKVRLADNIKVEKSVRGAEEEPV
ncbi:MAG: 30S ribosomal protein S4 [Candidatus Altiarchaeales archaeon]|nr:30S ribosomal protein S4 [Candidatus Altiarchaeales archaeon]MBD3415683.1 30S ribosomal protein S4 [Candidatus Altiarchaeales archaeon]